MKNEPPEAINAAAEVAGDDLAGLGQDRSLLIVDDDKPFLARLMRSMESRGFAVRCAESVAEGLASIAQNPPAFAVIDMRLGDGNGLDVIAELKAVRPDARGII